MAFIEVSEAREQMHKNKFVVADALYISHVLGRSFVEPHVSDSRLGEDRPETTSAVASAMIVTAPNAVDSRGAFLESAGRVWR